MELFYKEGFFATLLAYTYIKKLTFFVFFFHFLSLFPHRDWIDDIEAQHTWLQLEFSSVLFLVSFCPGGREVPLSSALEP